MFKNKKIKTDALPKFFDSLKQSGKIIIAPRRKGDKVFLTRVESFEQVAKDYIRTALSAKSVLFPRCEELLSYEFNDGNINILNNIDLENKAFPEGEVVVFGIRPCDAAAMEYMSDFFLKENTDAHFKKRLENTTFIAVSCAQADDLCFCTSVGLNPGSTKGSDILLTAMDDGTYYAEINSEKGNALAAANPNIFQDSPTVDKSERLAEVPVKFDSALVKGNLPKVFDTTLWMEQSLACLGCGACAFVCPTCSCFDIQDESNPYGGTRLRCWDTCAIGLFTLHASGHNPRSVQSQRWRQRLMHKFDYSDKTLGTISCVGCGRCIAVCPAQMNILENLITLQEAV